MTFKHLLARVAVGAGIGVAAAVMGAGLANADPASAHLQQAHSVAGGNQVHQAQPNISRVQPIKPRKPTIPRQGGKQIHQAQPSISRVQPIKPRKPTIPRQGG
jgi:hypothetical protein